VLDVAPGQIAVIPRGVRFRASCPTAGTRLCLRELTAALQAARPGADRLQRPGQSARFRNARRGFEDVDAPTEVIQKFMGSLWTPTLDHSPLDVVAWHGNLAPWRYDLSRFNTINTVSFDHPDPSIFTVLTSPSDTPGTRQCGLRDLPAALDGGRAHVPPAVVPPQRDERVHGPGHTAPMTPRRTASRPAVRRCTTA
jgi:homogentisate 1,2-dioxygenase